MENCMPLLKNNKYSITFPSSNKYLEKVESITVKIAREAGFDESSTDDLSIAITELFNNAIHHGNKDNIKKKVVLTFNLYKKKMSISIKDEGKGFKPNMIKDPLAPENLLAENGRGIYLVKMLMDDIQFNVTDKGSEIIITQNLL